MSEKQFTVSLSAKDILRAQARKIDDLKAEVRQLREERDLARRFIDDLERTLERNGMRAVRYEGPDGKCQLRIEISRPSRQ